MREKHRKSILLWGVVLLLIFLAANAVAGLVDYGTERSGETDDAQTSLKTSFTKEQLHVDLECGYEEKLRYGRQMQLTIEMDNRGADFAGYFEISFPTLDSGNYKKQVEVQQKEQKTAEMYVPLECEDGKINIALYREGGECLYEEQLSLSMDIEEKKVYIGVLSREAEQLGYLEGVDTNVTYLSKDSLPTDSRGLDCMDVLVVDHMDMQTVAEEKRRAIVKWVRSGGLLVLADAGEERELASFRRDLFQWRKRGSRTIRTSLGLRKKDMKRIRTEIVQERMREKQQEVQVWLRRNLPVEIYDKWREEILSLDEDASCIRQGGEIYNYFSSSFGEAMLEDLLSLSLTRAERHAALQGASLKTVRKKLQVLEMDNGEVLLSENGDVVLQRASAGRGRVFLSGIALTLKSDQWNVTGRQIREYILDSVAGGRNTEAGQHKKQQAAQIYHAGLQYTDWNTMPNIRLYIFVFAMYVLVLCGIGLFSARKPGRRMALWGLVPVAAVSFSILIYLLGTSTRKEGPYISYLNQIRLDQDGTGTIESRFRIVSGKSSGYEGAVEGGMSLDFPEETAAGQDASLEQSRVTLEQREGKTLFQVGELPCFSGVDLKTQDSVRLGGTLKGNIVMVGGQWRGQVQNTLDCPLEDCVLYYQGRIYRLGKIKEGETMLLDTFPASEIFTLDQYQDGYEMLMQQVFHRGGGLRLSACRMQRKWALLEACIRESETSQAFLYGYIPQNAELEGWYDTQKVRQQNILGGLEQLSWEKHGETGIYVCFHEGEEE